MDDVTRNPGRAASGNVRSLVTIEIARQARNRRRLQSAVGWLITVVLVAVPLLCLLTGLLGLDLFVIALTLAACLISACAVTARVWRCPGCGARLDVIWSTLQPRPLRFCPSCGARLVVDWDEVGEPDREHDRGYRP